MCPILDGYGVMTAWNLEEKVTIIGNKPAQYTIHLKYKCKVNFVKLPSIWIDLCLKLVSKMPPPAATQAGARLWTARVRWRK